MAANDDTAKTAASPWPIVIQMLVGIVFVIGGATYGRGLQIGSHVRLDFLGTRTEGTVQRLAGEKPLYRLSYHHPNGTVYSTTHEAWFGFRKLTEQPTELTLVYDPEEPNKFQPAGISYVPAGFVAVVLLMGLTFVADGNRRLQKRYRRTRLAPR